MAGRSGVHGTAIVPTKLVPTDQLRANKWNPNHMDGFMYSKALESIEEFDFIDPITVRTVAGQYEIVDGEHRWRAAKDLGYVMVPIWDLGEISDARAQRLTIVLNELKGRHDPRELGALLGDLLNGASPQEVLKGLPFSEEALEGLVGLKDFDWGSLERQELKTHSEDPSSVKEKRWVERVFRLPPDANEVLQDALDRVKAEEDLEDDWRALEYIAANYLSG